MRAVHYSRAAPGLGVCAAVHIRHHQPPGWYLGELGDSAYHKGLLACADIAIMARDSFLFHHTHAQAGFD